MSLLGQFINVGSKQKNRVENFFKMPKDLYKQTKLHFNVFYFLILREEPLRLVLGCFVERHSFVNKANFSENTYLLFVNTLFKTLLRKAVIR